MANRYGTAITNTAHVSRNHAAARARGSPGRFHAMNRPASSVINCARRNTISVAPVRFSQYVGRFRLQQHAQVDANPVALDDNRHRHSGLVICAERAPAVAFDDGEAVDGNQAVADDNAGVACRCCWRDLGHDDRARCRRIRLESGVDRDARRRRDTRSAKWAQNDPATTRIQMGGRRAQPPDRAVPTRRTAATLTSDPSYWGRNNREEPGL